MEAPLSSRKLAVIRDLDAADRSTPGTGWITTVASTPASTLAGITASKCSGSANSNLTSKVWLDPAPPDA